MTRSLIFALFCLIGTFSMAQNSYSGLAVELDSLAVTIPALNEPIDFTVSDLPLSEFVRGIANEAGLNVNLDPGLTQTVSNNFSNVKVKDLILFVQRNYNVEVDFIGNIMNIRAAKVPPISTTPPIIIEYQPDQNSITLEINNAPIQDVAREITRRTGQNVVLTPGVNSIVINSYIRSMPFYNALEKMAVGNNFKLSKTEDGFYLFEPVIQMDQNYQTNNNRNRQNNSQKSGNGSSKLIVNAYNIDSIDIKADNADLSETILKVFEPLKIPYQMLGEINETITLDLKGVSLKELLNDLFAGTKTTVRKMSDIYWIGPRELFELKDVRLVQLKYRIIDSLVDIIPVSLKKDVEIIEYPDLNSLILSGPVDRIEHLCKFIKEVDQVVPVVLIEVMFIDTKDSRALSTGISAGLADKPVQTSGTILPGADMTLGSEAVNSIIDGLNGFGWVNLGKVNSNFYMTIKAMEENGIIDLRSTPQLSTMNGHQATMSIGKTEYYKEESNIMYGTVTSSSQKFTTYKPVEAELKLVIRPLVSGNQEVTLNIKVEQSDFTDRIEEEAPPGKVSRKFESMIRIKDQEMILLGGLEEATKKDTQQGLPLLSRIPGLKWLFTSKTKVNSKSKLNIFIKPTIIS